MVPADSTEAWLRGPLPDYPPELMPAAHALVQAKEDIQRVLADITVDELWHQPGAAAPAGYHLQHLAGSLDRLLTCSACSFMRRSTRRGTSGQLITTLKVVRGR